jgi:hypothetical protein
MSGLIVGVRGHRDHGRGLRVCVAIRGYEMSGTVNALGLARGAQTGDAQ